jgi:hypothetical protein
MYNHLLPIVGTILYLNYPKHIRINSNALFYFSVIHNFGLAIFSGYTFITLSKYLYEDRNPIGHMILLNDKIVTKYDSLIFWFYISKYYEYLDTVLLYMQNKNPIFLQKFHHVGAVICWHLTYYNKIDAIIVGTILNSGVHTIMYSYYLLTLFKIRLTSLKPLITTGQIIQLILGNLYGSIIYYPPVETWSNYYNILFFDFYILILILLFANFYYNSYIIKKRPSNYNNKDYN